MTNFTRDLLLLFLTFAVIAAQAQDNGRKPAFTFGVIADVQYADVAQEGKRDYRGSLKRLEKCIEIFNAHDLSFIIHAGDLIDRHYESFDLPLGIFTKAKAPVHYVVGNHEFSVADSLKKHVRQRLKNERGYFSFARGNIQFIIVDAMDVSLAASIKDSRDYKRAMAIRMELINKSANNAHEWNGAMRKKQLRWMEKTIRNGDRRGYKSILFSHLPLLPENGLQLWNNQEVLKILNSYPSVIAFISGHHHEGGYVKEGHIHHLTLKGLVESRAERACGIVEVYPGELLLKGFGDQPGFSLKFEY